MDKYTKLWEKYRNLLPWVVGVIMLMIITIVTWQITNSTKNIQLMIAQIKNLQSRVSVSEIDAKKFEMVSSLLKQKMNLTIPDTNKIIDPFGPLPKRKTDRPTIQDVNKK